jgi:hypothetical protein
MKYWNGKNWEDVTYLKIAKMWKAQNADSRSAEPDSWYKIGECGFAVEIFAEYLDRKAARNKKLGK